MPRRNAWQWLPIAVVLWVAHIDPAAAQRPRVDVGLVVDVRGPHVERLRTTLATEVQALTQREFDVRFSSDYTVTTDGTVAGARRSLELLYRAAAVDLVIAGGPVVAHAALELGRAGRLPKPTVASGVLHAGVQRAPLAGQASGVGNLNYIAFPTDVPADLRVLAQIVDFNHVAFLFSGRIATAIPELEAHYLAAARAVGAEATVVAVSGDVDAVLAALPAVADAVFLAQPLDLGRDGMARLAAGLRERRLPSFSAVGTSQVEAGVLLGLHSDADQSRLARRVALNIQRILLGEDAGTLPVFFHRSERLTINMTTADAIGVSPSWSVLTEAELVGARDESLRRQLTLTAAVREAMGSNLDLAAARYTVAAGRQQVREARARLLPQFELQAAGVLIEEGLGSPLQTESSVDGTAAVRQALYAEPAWAAWAAQKHLQRGREAELEQVRLDVAQAVAVGYLNVLRAKTAERVQKQNLELTRSNLELARVRREIGVSGPSEVFRWESQIATARRAVILANATRNQAEIGLNRLLHRPLEEAFDIEETGLFDPDLVTHDERFRRFLADKRTFRVFRDFMVHDGLSSAPELIALDAAIAAGERTLVSSQRAHWQPAVGLRGALSRHLLRDGAGAQQPAPGGDASWSLGISASLPLWSGGGKFAAAARAAEELAQLSRQREALTEAVAARIRVTMHQAGASYAAIGLSEDAAVAAAKNLELVEDAYGRGVVSILALLDAQNAATLAEQGAANSVFDFLVDLMATERALGKFYLFAEDERREAWFARANDYIDARLP